ncbi:MAG: alpha/beta fold hydrolase [Leptospiraceae bacterium]|nr:alpha/beta fold hydrolase [Leptospiraceae bacterium]MCP5499768.1 alpha/beta fold hydrolase [Leptospiraceae bacterium]
MKINYINSNDVKLLVKTSVPENLEEKPETLLFLHGYPDNHKTWSHQIESFKDNYRIIVFDIRGCGGSTPPPSRKGYHIDHLMQDVDNVLNVFLEKDEKVHLVGHDWGAIIFWSYISIPSYAKRVASFTAICGPHPTLALKNLYDNIKSFDPFNLFATIDQLAKSWYVAFLQIPRIPEFLLYSSPEMMWNILFSQSGLPESDDIRHFSREEILSTSVGPINLYRELIQGGLPPLPEEPIAVPITVIGAEKDLAITKLAYENIDKIARQVDIRYIDANHWIHREKSADVNKLISIFLKRIALRKNT